MGREEGNMGRWKPCSREKSELASAGYEDFRWLHDPLLDA